MKLKSLLLDSLFLFAVLAGCSVNDYGDCRSSEFTLALDIRVPAASADAATKAADRDKGSSAESAIDDIRILVFDERGEYLEAVAHESLVRKESPDYTVYSLEGKLDPKNNDLESFRVMVLANWTCFDGSDYDGFGTDGAKSISDIAGNREDFNFTIKHGESDGVTKTWKPSNSDPKALIPMFGMSDNLKVDSFFADKDGVVRVDATISMLRALAKVEIVDATEGEAITSVSLSSSNLNGRFIPAGIDGPGFNPDDITAPSLPTTIETVEDLVFVKDENGVWVAYIPEMTLNNESRPVFNMNIGTVQFDNYSNNAPTNTLDAVLRNHIYRYNVKAKSTSLKIEFNLLPWDMEWDDTPTYFTEPEVGDYITWVTTVLDDPDDPGSERPNGYDDNTGDLRFTMKPSIDEYAECSFTLSAPLKAKWNAYLRKTSGELDAFYFTTGVKRENPSDEDSYFIEGDNSGIIDGNPVTLKIACRRGVVNAENNEALLVIMVQYPDKTQKEAIVVDPSKKPDSVISKPYTNYTIVQTVTNIM